jgi:hypothetical protein
MVVSPEYQKMQNCKLQGTVVLSLKYDNAGEQDYGF